MQPAMQALCYYYRHPPPNSGVQPQPFRAIPALIQRQKIHWLSNPKNALVLRLDEPAWTTGEATGPAETNDMATCGVGGVQSLQGGWRLTTWLVRRRTSVRKAPTEVTVLAFTTADELAHDLRTTPFVAKKVLRLRDAHLAAQPQT